MIKYCLDMNKIAQCMDNFQAHHSIIKLEQNHLCRLQNIMYKSY